MLRRFSALPRETGLAASPAVGYYSKHNAQQKALIDSALGEIEYYKLA